MIKKMTNLLVLGLLFFGAHTTHAQVRSDIQAKIKETLVSLIDKLSVTQDSSSEIDIASFELAAGTVCGLSYTGDTSIIAIQQELQNQGYAITKVDGKYGPETKTAVTEFQKKVSAQKVDGIIGEETRKLLSRASLRCLGQDGVKVSASNEGTSETIDALTDKDQVNSLDFTALCQLSYAGDTSIIAIQQELQNQGYAVTKVDGKYGPETKTAVTDFQKKVSAQKVDGIIGEETRIALSRESLSCTQEDQQEEERVVNISATPDVFIGPKPLAEQVSDPVNEESVDPATAQKDALFQKTEITAGVRSGAGGIPDDTAVITYKMIFNGDQGIYISKNPDTAFNISLMRPEGVSSGVTGIQSIVTTGKEIMLDNGVSYFKISKGDSLSLRSSIQPGAGTFLGNLDRLTYTRDNVASVASPAVVNHVFDTDSWESAQVQLLN